MSNFQQASHFIIETLNQTDVRVDLEQHKLRAFALLLSEIVQGASHDAGERFDAPTCHPDTRTAVLNDITSWVDNDNEPTRIMWLNGPAGAGKSAIAQTTAENCEDQLRVAGSFFFSRFVAGHNSKIGLIATIAFQLCVSIPGIKEHIVNAIVKKPNIFKANIKTQFKTLIVDPYRLLDLADGELAKPRLVIIDGLDECDNSDHQAEIINALATSLSNDQTSPSRLRILITSRPEPRIRQTFDEEAISSISTRLTLDDKYSPAKDIGIFLRSSFQALKRNHTLAPMLQSWPPESSINTIIKKSSGQFIYAATVVKYISDSQQNPIRRLDIVLNITNEGGEQPLAQLDALYTAILCNIRRDYKKVASIFEAIMFLQDFSGGGLFSRGRLLSASFLDTFLFFGGEILLFLADLSSIVDTDVIRNNGFQFFHASFSDYLQDSSRSQKFHIDGCQSHARLAIYCINHITVSPAGATNAFTYSVNAIFNHFRLSNWDNYVLDLVISRGLLEISARKAYGIPSFYSFLWQLIGIVDGREKVNDYLRNAIDAAFLNHLQEYEPHDIVFAFYATTWIELDETLPLGIVPAQIEGDISKHNILFDTGRHGNAVRRWFKLLIRDSGYLIHVPQDAYIKSTCHMLEILMKIACSGHNNVNQYGRADKSAIPASFLQFTREPISDEIANTIRKWESIQPTSEQLDKECDEIKFRIKQLDDIIQSYRMRALTSETNVGVFDFICVFAFSFPVCLGILWTFKVHKM